MIKLTQAQTAKADQVITVLKEPGKESGDMAEALPDQYAFEKNISAGVGNITDRANTAPAILLPSRSSHQFGNLPLQPKPSLIVQPKLTVNTPGDEYEQEADAMADKVMGMADAGALQATPSRAGSGHRKCDVCGKEEEVKEEKKIEEEAETAEGIVVQRKCAACEDEENNKVQRKEHSSVAAWNAASVQQVLQSKGQPLDRSIRSFMERRFGFDFGKVQIHNSATAHQSAKDINALAYTHQHNIVFGSGQYKPYIESGKRLLAHELTHVVQQRKGNIIQRMADMSLADQNSLTETGRTEEETSDVDENQQSIAEAKFIVEDGVVPAKGQMQKADFLEALNAAVCATVDEGLKGTQFSSDNCPYIKAAFAKHSSDSPLYIEQLIDRYSGIIDKARNAQEVIQLMQARVMDAVKNWLKTGDMSQVPQEIQSEIYASMSDKVKERFKAKIKSLANPLFKAKPGGARITQSAQDVLQGLGKGKQLETRTRNKMESALGADFSEVEIHTDPEAAGLTSEMNARAFSVGNHIVFGSGEYKPGTIVGDALMAHELAHVQQQQGTYNLQEDARVSGSTDEKIWEQEADEAAVHVVSQEFTNQKKKPKKPIKKARGLSLQKCDLLGTDFSDMEPGLKDEIRNSILSQTKIKYTPDPERENIYAGTTMSIQLEAPEHVDDGARQYPYIQSLVYEFPDGTKMPRMVNQFSNQFMTTSNGMHKISGTIKFLPDMAPAVFEKKINVVSLRSLVEPIAFEDTSKSQRGQGLFAELLAFQNTSGELRTKALKIGLAQSVLSAWFEANAQVIVVEGLLKESKPVDDKTHTDLITRITAFTAAFRNAVSGKDVKKMEDVYVDEGQYEKQEVTRNPFFSPVQLNFVDGLVQHKNVGIQVKTNLFLSVTTQFDQYIADLYKKSGDEATGKTLTAVSTTENALRGLYVKHGNLKTIKAVFYPNEQDQLEGGVKKGAASPENYRAKKYDLRFYTYTTKNKDKTVWHLVDATNPARIAETEAESHIATSPPDSLFTDLDNASRFPTGILSWQLPDGSVRFYEIVHPLTFAQFLTYLGIGLAVLGITLATAGAGTAATIFLVSSGIVGAAGAIADINEKSNLGVLTSKDIFLDGLTIATSLLSAGTLAAGRVIAVGAGTTGTFAKLAVGLDKIYKPLAGLTLTADLISLAVFTVDFAHQVTQIIDSTELSGDAKKEAMVRLIFQGLLTGGLTLLAVKGSIADFNKGRSLYLDLSPTGSKARLILPDTNLLGSSLITATKKTKLEEVFKQLDAPDKQSTLFQLKAEISAAVESRVVKEAEISALIDKIAAEGGNVANIEKRIADFRAKNILAVKADFEIFKNQATARGLTEGQAAISYDVSKSLSQSEPTQVINKSEPLEKQVDELYTQATKADAELKSLVNNVTGETGGTPGFRPAHINNGLKGRVRALEKINGDYGGDASMLIDIAGAEIIFKKVDELYAALKKISQKVNIVKFKDKIVEPYASGYSDVKLSLKMSNGHIVELKLLLKDVEEISAREHVLYEKKRSGIAFTPAEEVEFSKFKKEYEEALKKTFEQNK